MIRETNGTGWRVSKLDKQKLDRILEDLQQHNDIEQAGAKFSRKLVEICDSVMPRKQSSGTRQPMYWWNDGIAELRRDCLKWLRKYIRARRNGPVTSLDIWDNYQEKKKNLRKAIRKSKKDCWKSVCDKVDCDIWGTDTK